MKAFQEVAGELYRAFAEIDDNYRDLSSEEIAEEFSRRAAGLVEQFFKDLALWWREMRAVFGSLSASDSKSLSDAVNAADHGPDSLSL